MSQTVVDSWDDNNPSRLKTLGYVGSEEFIRLQFEEYLLALLSAVKYHLYLQHSHNAPMPSVEGDPATDFNTDWVHTWRQTACFGLFDKITDSHLFDIVEPHHPTAGNMNIEDIQRRLAQQIQTLHLDERFATSKEAVNRHITTGQKKVSTAFAHIWADIEAMREAQRRRQAEAQKQAAIESKGNLSSPAPSEAIAAPAARRLTAQPPDLTTAQASMQAASQKAGAYLSSWGAWASERRKGWAKQGLAGSNESETAVDTISKAPSSSKLQRWSSLASTVNLGKATKEEKGPDGIGRLDA